MSAHDYNVSVNICNGMQLLTLNSISNFQGWLTLVTCNLRKVQNLYYTLNDFKVGQFKVIF